MKKSDFYYELPQELIAQSPATPRDSSRLLVYNRETNSTEHKIFSDLPNYLQKGDVLVINNTRVLPARIFGVKTDTGARIELLLHKRLNLKEWEVLARPIKRLKTGSEMAFSSSLSAKVLKIGDEGIANVRFEYDGVFESILSQIGEMPLPPYIKEKPTDSERYQTVYSKSEGSSAAPTAGLHFTPDLLNKIKSKGVEIVEVLLHVGLGTFRPVKTDDINEHKMHSEHFEITQSACDVINAAKRVAELLQLVLRLSECLKALLKYAEKFRLCAEKPIYLFIRRMSLK